MSGLVLSRAPVSRAVSIIVVCLFLTSPLMGVPADSPSVNASTHMLRLRAGEFDPLRDPLPIPDGLALGELGDLQIVQFDGTIQNSWRTCLESYGKVLTYLPDNSYLFRSDPKNADSVRMLPHVRYVGNFEPGYKLDGALPRNGEVITMDVLYFRDLDRYQVAADIAALGARIIAADPILIRVEAPGALAERIAFLPSVMWVGEYHPPVMQNGNAGRIVKVRSPTDGGYDWATSNYLWSFNATSQKYEGYAGANYTAAVADTGVDGTHPGFTGKKVAYYGYGTTNWTDSSGHGTHTAGTVVGHGDWRASNPGPMGQYAGMAPLAGLVAQNTYGPDPITYYNLTNDVIKYGAVVTSNSWGATMGAYTPDDYSYDILVRDSDMDMAGNQSISAVFSAGNTGSNPFTVCSPSSAKNVISVGALDDSTGTSVAGFSARGTTVDGRVKPDVMAPGVNVVSCSRGGTSYVGMSGTSMSCPTTAGCVVIVYEYCNRTNGALPSPALVRNLLVNGADTIGGYAFAGKDVGWGRVNMGRSLLNSTARKIWYEDQRYTLSTGENKLYGFNTTSSAELKISLAWTDEPGAVYANPAIVNNLDLTVTAPDGTVYKGNNFASGYSVAGGNNDTRNNTEVFRLASPQVGRWLVSVRGFNVPIVAQDYSLVIAGPIGNVVRETVDTAALDLAASSMDPAEGDELTFTGNIANVGSLPLPNHTYRFRLKYPNNATVILGQAEIPPMSVGAKTGVQARWKALRGNFTLFLDADPNMTVFEDSEENNTMVMQFRVRGYGIEMGCTAPSGKTDPARQSAIGCYVINKGNTKDTFELSVPPGLPTGWNVSLDPPSITAGAGENASFRALITPPATAKAYETLDFQVRAVSAGNRTYNTSVNLTVTVNQVFGMELTAVSQEMIVKPGETARYPLSVMNTGNGPDTVALTVTGFMPGWRTQLTESQIILQSGKSRDFTLTVLSPVDGKAFDTSVFTVTSASGNNTKHHLNITTRIKQLIEIGLEQEGGPSTVDPSASVTYMLRVKNGGNYDETMELEAEAPPNWTCYFEAPAIQVPARSTKTDGLAVEVPLDALAGEYKIPVTMRPSADRNVSASLNISFQVRQRFGLGFSADGKTRAALEAGNGTTFELVLTNPGNGRDTYRLLVTDSPSSSWDIFINASEIVLGPRESARILLSVTSPKDSTEGIFSTTVRAESAGDMALTSEVQFKIDLSVPPAPPTPPTPPPPPPPPPPDEPTVQDNSLMAKIRSNWLPIALLVTVLIALTVVAVAMRSNRRKKMVPEADEAGNSGGPEVAEPSAAAQSYTPLAPPSPPADAPPAVPEVPAPPTATADSRPAGPQSPPPVPPIPEASPATPQPMTSSQTAPSAEISQAAPSAAPQAAPSAPEMPAPASASPADSPAPTPAAPETPQPAQPATPPTPSTPQPAPTKKLDDDLADILSKLNDISK